MNAVQRQATSQESEETKLRRLHPDVTDSVSKVFCEICNELGGGSLEGVYHKAFAKTLRRSGHADSVQVAVSVYLPAAIVGDLIRRPQGESMRAARTEGCVGFE